MPRTGNAPKPADGLQEALRRLRDLERSNAELSRFAEVAAHELGEPLRKMQQFAGFLAPGAAASPEEAADYAARIGAAADRLGRLLNSLLDLARAGKGGADLAPVPLDEVLNEAAEDLFPKAAAAGGSLLLRPLPPVMGDRALLVMLFRGLLSNALKFSRAGIPPCVEVACPRAAGPFVDIEVVDNGIGFDPVHARRVFEPFERLNRREDFAGAGLGLSLCARIAERHGGTVAARSVPGAGSTFIVTLPSVGAEPWRGS